MATDGGFIAVALGVVTLLAKAGVDIFKDSRSAKTEDKKTEQTGESSFQQTMLSAVSASQGAATDWMGRYAGVLEKLAEVQGAVADLRANVNTLTGKVAQLEDDKRLAQEEARRAIAECVTLRAENLDLRAERDRFERGWNGALEMLAGVAEGRADAGITNTAADAVRAVLEWKNRKDC